MSTTSFGAHVDQDDPVAEATARGADAVQIFLGNPQGFKGPEVRYPGGAAALREAAAAAGIRLYVHAPYLVNVATTNNRIRIPSRKLLQQHVTAAAEIGAAGVIVHGGHLQDGDDPGKGFDNWRKCIDGLELAAPVLIENTAGGTNSVARGVDKIEQLWASVLESDRGADIGFCLDTCHAYAGGEELAGLVERVRAVTGRIDLVHLNDSRDAFDSGADRHANLGQGTIPDEELVAVVREAGAPVIVETPGGAPEHGADIAWIKERLAG